MEDKLLAEINALEKELEQLKHIVYNAPATIYLNKTTEIKNLWSNDQIFYILGYTDEEIDTYGYEELAKRVISTLPIDDQIGTYWRSVDFFNKYPDKAFFALFRINDKYNQTRWFCGSTAAFDFTANNKPLSGLSCCVDITDEIKTDQQLYNSLKANQMLSYRAVIDERLSKREKEVLAWVCKGLTSKEVAEKMHLSLKTVETHRYNILKKLGCSNIAAAANIALLAGLGT